MDNKKTLSINKLSVAYKDKVVLDNINLELGLKCYGLMGKSGSGKSTFIKAILGLIPYEGEIYLDNKIVKKNRKGFQVVFQNSFKSFDPTFTIRQSIEELCRANGTSFDLDELFESYGMNKNLLDKKPKSLSGGELQRASIIRAVAQKPKVLLLDEPTASLDVLNQKKILQMIKGISDTVIILVSHDLKTIDYTCDEKLILDKEKKNIVFI
ncbi:ATP-binding cassette domain-containing protein [Lagierella sp.]|uniref:ABC transporter ATP-binding protein n=1 Tax=Lagierella sp. TaxID=2849657 RepID=UPI00262CED6F|nr:ATP-binding cassette domain-containing protein [Lagierella sp.]